VLRADLLEDVKVKQAATFGSRIEIINDVYPARTFSSRRYESDVLNSFGHPAPLVNGKLQKTGRQASGRLIDGDRRSRLLEAL